MPRERNITGLSMEAEALVEEQAVKFEEQKDYLIKVWDQKSAEKTRAQRKEPV